MYPKNKPTKTKWLQPNRKYLAQTGTTPHVNVTFPLSRTGLPSLFSTNEHVPLEHFDRYACTPKISMTKRLSK